MLGFSIRNVDYIVQDKIYPSIKENFKSLKSEDFKNFSCYNLYVKEFYRSIDG